MTSRQRTALQRLHDAMARLLSAPVPVPDDVIEGYRAAEHEIRCAGLSDRDVNEFEVEQNLRAGDVS